MTAEPDGPEDRLRRFATIWSRAVFPVTSTSLTRPEFEQELLPLARRLSRALHARPLDADEGRAVGAALVSAHCTDPEALSRTLDCVDAYLVLYCGEDGDREELRARCARLQHAMAAGFAQKLRERTLAEQEAISAAALKAQGVVAQALHATEARFRAVFEGAAIGIGMADLDGNILQVNGALLRMFGIPEDALRTRNVKEWTHPEDAPQTWTLYEELVRGEREHYHLEKAFYRPDGTVLWTNLTVSLLRDAD
ncbi:PAS domain S-box protein, partial [Streptomyces sp. NPDC001759]